MTKRRKSGGISIMAVIIAVLALIFAITSLIFIIKSRETQQTLSEYKYTAESESEVALDNISDLTAQRDSLTAERDNLTAQLNALQEEKNKLIESFENSDSLYKQLNDKYDAMSAQLTADISDRDAKIAKLEQNIAELEKVYLVDINSQFDLLNRLTELLSNLLPNEKEVETENADGTVTTETVTVEPRLALYYHDLRNGYTYAYNAEELFDPASMVKAPYILALLMAASDEEAQIAEQKKAFEAEQQQIKASGGEVKEWQEPTRRFDMEKKITYTREEYFQSGSGEIVESEDGTEYTYRELFYHVLECSDNVAYAILKEEYGNEEYSDLVVSLGAKSLYQKPAGMTAHDACRVMEAIYEFTESDAYYAAFMKDAMIGSRHLVIISYGCAPNTVAHKYGWDEGSYCDMGIVYADSPYVVSILTNYDGGGKEVNEYLQSILQLINEMHGNFYLQR